MITTIAFDADDTLWVNETYFREAEERFCLLLQDYMAPHSIHQELFKTEIKNLDLYGYGIKGFMLSMIETIIDISGNTAPLPLVGKALEIGKEMLEKDIELLPDIEEVLKGLQGKYKLIVATKGDLLDQERKLEKSGLKKYFHHVEVMSNKKEKDYQKLLKQLDCKAENFMMIGNSLKSDILPVLELGASAIHVPFHTTWEHEHVDIQIKNERFKQADSTIQILEFLQKNMSSFNFFRKKTISRTF